MMRADAAQDEATKLSAAPPLVLGVTVLTSMDDAAMAELGIAATAAQQVARLTDPPSLPACTDWFAHRSRSDSCATWCRPRFNW